MGMKVEAARQLTYAAAGRSERNDPDLTFFGAAAKCFASDVAMEVTTNAVQVLGGYGFTRDYPVERMMRDAKITQIYEGTNQVQRIVMARQLLAGVQSASSERCQSQVSQTPVGSSAMWQVGQVCDRTRGDGRLPDRGRGRWPARDQGGEPPPSGRPWRRRSGGSPAAAWPRGRPGRRAPRR